MENINNEDNLINNQNNDNKYNPYHILKNLLIHKVENDTLIFCDKFYPLFNDFILWKNITNKEEKYELYYKILKDRTSKELSTKKYSDLSEAEKSLYLLQFKSYINHILNIKNYEVKQIEQTHSERTKQIKDLQEKIKRQSMEDMKYENKLKYLDEKKQKRKIALTNKLESLKDKILRYKDRIMKSEEIISNYENSIGNEETLSIMNIVSGLKDENNRLSNICEEQEIEIANLDKKKKELEEDIRVLDKTPNNLKKY